MWDWFLDLITNVIVWFHSWCGDWGLAILLITVLFRILIYPITRKQFKTNYKMQKMQPQINAIREKYADDQQRMQQETMRIYQEAKFNPLSGCLPMILQMPIFIALYQVLLDFPGRISRVTGTAAENIDVSFFGIIPDLKLNPATVFAEQGIIALLPYIILVLLFGVSMLVPMLTQKDGNNQTKIMGAVMCVIMLWFGWQAPAGVLLYWDMSSIIGVAQQMGSRYMYRKKDEKAEEEMVDVLPVKVEVDRKEKKARPRKKGK